MIFIITGTSSGLGKQLAIKLCDYGLVVGISRNSLAPDKLANYGESYQHYTIDLSAEPKIVRQKYSDLLVALPKEQEVKLIINAAQFVKSEAILDPEVSRSLYNCNFFNATALVKLTIEHGLKRVLFINSISGLVAQANQPDYSASKHALQAYADVLSQDAKNKSYDVMSVNPGGINTELWDHVETPPDVSQFMDPNELASLLVSLITLKGRYFIKNMTILPPIDV